MTTSQTEVIKKATQVTAYDPFRAQLLELKKINESVVFNLETKKGIKDAKSHIHKLRQAKSDVEKARVKEKSVSLIYGRLVDSQAKEIVAEVDDMIDVHKKPIDEIEQREKDRVANHREAIDDIINTLPIDEAGCIQKAIATISEIVIDDSWDEFYEEAKTAKANMLVNLDAMLKTREKADTDAAELDRLKKSEDARKQKELEDSIALQAVENERKRVIKSKKQTQNEFVTRETELVASAERAEREKKEADERAANAEVTAKKKADDDLAAAKRAREQAAVDREKDVQHHAKINREALSAFIKGGLNVKEGKLVLTLIAKKQIPHVTISY